MTILVAKFGCGKRSSLIETGSRATDDAIAVAMKMIMGFMLDH
jgi:hypothetical protein